MAKFFLTISFFLLFSATLFSQPKEYKLIDKTPASDINYSRINAIDSFGPGMKLIDEVFNTTRGKFIVYRFLATFKGLSYTNEQKIFHDILIVKTNRNNKIVDAYQYTLEWAERPCENDLYKSSCKGVYLAENMRIDLFKLSRPWYHDGKDAILKEFATIKLK